MKRLFTLLLIAVLVGGYAQAQNKSKHVVRVNGAAILPFFQPDLVSYEYAFHPQMSLGVGVSYGKFSGNYSGSGGNRGKGEGYIDSRGILFDWRYYANSSKGAPRGFFLSLAPEFTNIAAGVNLVNGAGATASFNTSTNFVALGARIGWQWIIADHFAINLLFGPRFGTGINVDWNIKYSDGSVESDSFKTPVLPSFALGLGAAF